MPDRHYYFDLPEGPVEITLPYAVSSEDMTDIKEFFSLILRGIARRSERKRKNAPAH